MLRNAFEEDGFAQFPSIISSDECELIATQVLSEPGAVGSRGLLRTDWCADLSKRLREEVALSRFIPRSHAAVQCTYFEKSSDLNWLVTSHQDLSIPVAERIDEPSIGGWSEKEGELFVQPPIEVLEQLVAVRLHLDSCSLDDGPLRVVPGSHKLGRLSPESVASLGSSSEVRCPSGQGGVLLMRPLLLHASSKAKGSSRRRVLHFLYGPRILKYGLRWAYAV